MQANKQISSVSPAAVNADAKQHIGGDSRFNELMSRLYRFGSGKGISASEWDKIVEFIDRNVTLKEVSNPGAEAEMDAAVNVALAKESAGINQQAEKSLIDKKVVLPIITCREDYANGYHNGYCTGTKDALANIRDQILNAAADNFKLGLDSRAKELRDLANEFVPHSKHDTSET